MPPYFDGGRPHRGDLNTWLPGLSQSCPNFGHGFPDLNHGPQTATVAQTLSLAPNVGHGHPDLRHGSQTLPLLLNLSNLYHGGSE